MPTRGPSPRPARPKPLRAGALRSATLRSTARRLALESPGWLMSLTGPDRDLVVRRELAVDDPEQLLGLVADDAWRGVALVLPGHTDDLAGATDAVTLSYVVDRSGRSALAIRCGEAVDTVESMVGASGFIDDAARRVLGLPCAPEPATSAVLILSVWLEHLLDASSDPDASGGIVTWTDVVGQHPAWRAGGGPFAVPGTDGTHRPDELAELTVALGRHLDWERLRGLAGDGSISIPGLAASEAAWMDWPFFARWTLGVHRPVTELLDDLSLFIDGGVLRDVRYTVDAVGWLGFADSHAS